MAKVFIEETTLTAIGDAIRGKEGTTDLVPVTDMATRITDLPEGGGGGYEPTDEDLTYKNRGDYAFSHDKNKWLIEQYGDRITTKDIKNGNYMFAESTYEEIPFVINVTSCSSLASTFYNMQKLKVCPKIRGQLTYGTAINGILDSCSNLRDCEDLFTPEMFEPYQNYKSTSAYGLANMSNCLPKRSLRKLPSWFYALRINPECTVYPSGSYTIYNALSNFIALDEIVDLPVWKCKGALTSNAFPYNFIGKRIKNFTFETNEDGTPIVTEWKNQTIDFYAVGYFTSPTDVNYLLNFNSGITADKRVGNEIQYAALKDDPDWYAYSTTMNAYSIALSRYNKTSAIATINSLPDTSAYLATAGGTNTIKFKASAGELTDGGAINTLTEEEIAVATAKGWTVTFVS